MKKEIVLTGDRPTGKLHLGHYVGSLAKRLEFQEIYDQYVLVANMQALTDHMHEPELITNSIQEVMLDYLAIGLDPKKTTICLQSHLPALSELFMYYLNLVTWNQLKHNPTVKAEIVQKKMGEEVPAGFMTYPISQAADITAFKAKYVPVGDDQIPMLEDCAHVVKKFNRIYKPVLVEPVPILSEYGRLPGIDGNAKMSKSLNNAIYLADSADEVAAKVKKMFTDPKHLKVEDPGNPDNPVFLYLSVFDPDQAKVEEMKDHYRRGGLGDVVVKKRLLDVMQAFLEPIRKRRQELQKDPSYVMDVLKKGTEKARITTNQTLLEVREALGIKFNF
jgi:tryptophanyl-tRNA synthetase